jgi:hypothetical protein
MRRSIRICILIVLVALALGDAASAAYPVVLSVTGDHVWMVADNKDTATINVTVTSGTGDNAGQPLPNANVSFSVNSPWQLKDSFLLTNNNGIATTTLQSTKVSGTANITVTAWALIYSDILGYQNFSVTQYLNQAIDHTTPSSMTTYYNGQVQVRTSTPISVLIKDKWGNPVDNRNVVEMVKFVASSTGISGFQSGTSWVKSITVPVNESGYATVQYLVDPPGVNYVSITPPSPIAQKLIAIQGLSQGVPFKVTSIVSPGGTPYPYTTVKTGQFTIGFTLLDQFGYATQNQPVNITTSVPGESMALTTNKNGMVIITYGPKDIAGIYNITATAANNKSASALVRVEFVSGAATNALLTASPLTMASRDVKDDITSTLVMRVMDVKGNPVQGETVNFRFKSFSVSNIYNQTQGPILENGVTFANTTGINVAAVSDADGEATVTFHPGAFTTDFNAPKYNATAMASAVVEAQWSTVTQQITLTYLNYPYLTVQSWVNPTTVEVNETVDVTVQVKGDGWALQPKPIDVFLLDDRSGSMIDDYPDREVSVMAASNVFNTQLDYTRDRLGLVSFGGNGVQDVTTDSNCNAGVDGDCSDDAAYAIANYPGNGRSYSDYATLDLNLSKVPATINSKINQTVPGGYTPMRYALKIAIDAMKTQGRPNAVRALIVLSDGDYNHYGDPLARVASKSTTSTSTSSYSDLTSKWYTFSDLSSSNQNMSTYANANTIKIFTIGFAQSISAGGKANLTSLATQTGGKYYDATAANLAGVYTDIAGSLKDTAGANTNMTLSFQNINVTNATYPGNQVYNYTYINGHSTLIDTGNATFLHFSGYPVTFDNTSQWMSSQKFFFNIGTIRLGQFWQATITLRVLKDGNIKVFDPAGSSISVADSPFPLKIPDAYFTALPNNTANALQGAAQLNIQNLVLTDPGSTDDADLQWNLVYNGMYPISEDIMISQYGLNQWTHQLQQVSNTTTSDTADIPLTGYPTGYYTIQVAVNAYDSNSDSESLNILLSDTGISVLPPGFIPPAGTPGPTLTPKPMIKIS